MRSEYFIELLVTGALGIFTLVMLFFGIVGIEWIHWLKDIKIFHSEGVWTSILIMFPFVYIAGIIIDRFVDAIYDKFWGDEIINSKLGNRYEYTKKVTKLFLTSDKLADAYNYTRMRIRICRSTSFLSLVLLIAVIIFIVNSGLYGNPSLIFNMELKEFDMYNWHKIYIVGSTFVIIGLIITICTSFSAWKALNYRECARLNMRMEILDEINNKKEE